MDTRSQYRKVIHLGRDACCQFITHYKLHLSKDASSVEINSILEECPQYNNLWVATHVINLSSSINPFINIESIKNSPTTYWNVDACFQYITE